MIAGARSLSSARRADAFPISHLAGDRAQFDALPSMELIKRGRAICSYTPGPERRGDQRRVGGRQYRKVGSPGDPGINAVENPPRRRRLPTTTDYSVGTCMIWLASDWPHEPSPLHSRFPCALRAMRGSNHSRDGPFYSIHPRPLPRAPPLCRATDTRRAAPRAAARIGTLALPSAAPSALRTISLTPGTLCREICNLSI